MRCHVPGQGSLRAIRSAVGSSRDTPRLSQGGSADCKPTTPGSRLTMRIRLRAMMSSSSATARPSSQPIKSRPVSTLASHDPTVVGKDAGIVVRCRLGGQGCVPPPQGLCMRWCGGRWTINSLTGKLTLSRPRTSPRSPSERCRRSCTEYRRRQGVRLGDACQGRKKQVSGTVS